MNPQDLPLHPPWMQRRPGETDREWTARVGAPSPPPGQANQAFFDAILRAGREKRPAKTGGTMATNAEAKRLRDEAGRLMVEAKAQAAAMHKQAELLENPPAPDAVTALTAKLDSVPHGVAILFNKTWGHGRGAKVYSYAAVRDNEGLWNTTGPKSPKKYTSRMFAGWLTGRQLGGGNPVEDIVFALRGDTIWTVAMAARANGRAATRSADEQVAATFQGAPPGYDYDYYDGWGEF